MRTILIILCLSNAVYFYGQENNGLLPNEGSQFENEQAIENAPNSKVVVAGEEKNPLPSDELKKKVEQVEEQLSESLKKSDEILQKLQKIQSELKNTNHTIGTLKPFGFENIPVRIQISATEYANLETKKNNVPSLKEQIEKDTKELRDKKIRIAELKSEEEPNQELIETLQVAVAEIQSELNLKKEELSVHQSIDIIKVEEQHYKNEKVNIDSIRIVSDHGYLSEIRAYFKVAKNGSSHTITVAHRYPTSVINGNTARWNLKFLVSENSEFKHRICLKDLLNYIPYRNRLYPEKDEHVFKKEDVDSHLKTLKRSYNLGNVLEGRIYSDANGVINDRSFGIIQTELKMRVLMNTRNDVWGWNWRNFVPLNNAEIKLNMTKFDSQFDTLGIENYTDRINATSLISRSFRQLNFDFSAIQYQNFINFNMRFGYQLNSTRIRASTDSVGGYSANVHSFVIEPRWKLPIAGENIVLEASPKFLWIQSMNNTGPNFKGVRAGIFNPEVVLNYHPDDEKKQGFYFRWVLFDNINYNEDDVMFWQIGYKVTFNELLKGSEGE